MTEQELKEIEGGFVVPERFDTDGLVEDLINGAFTFKRLAGGVRVWLDGTEDDDLTEIAARNGFTICGVDATEGPFNAEVLVEGRTHQYNIENGIEMRHRVDEENQP